MPVRKRDDNLARRENRISSSILQSQQARKRKLGKKREFNSELAKPGVVANIIAKKLEGKIANNNQVKDEGSGSLDDAKKMQLKYLPETKQQIEAKQENERLNNPYTAEGVANLLGKKPANDNDKNLKKEQDRIERENARQQILRNEARNKFFIGENENDTNASIQYQQELDRQVEIIIEGLASYGTIDTKDAIEILKNRIEGADTFMNKFVDFLILFSIFLLGCLISLISTMLSFAGPAAPVGIVIGFIGGIFMLFLRLANSLRSNLKMKSLARKTTNIDKIPSLKKIIEKRLQKTKITNWIIKILNIIQSLLSAIPYVGILFAIGMGLPIAIFEQIISIRYFLWQKKLLRTIKNLKASAGSL